MRARFRFLSSRRLAIAFVLASLSVLVLWNGARTSDDYYLGYLRGINVAVINDESGFRAGFSWYSDGQESPLWGPTNRRKKSVSISKSLTAALAEIPHYVWPLVQNTREVQYGSRYRLASLGRFVQYEKKSDPVSAVVPFNSETRVDLHFFVPHAVAFIACLMQPAIYIVRKQRRLQPGLCLGCGYDLRASPERCPECGLVIRPATPPPDSANRPPMALSPQLRWTVIALGVKVCILFVWIYVICRWHVETAWPAWLTVTTSAPLFYRFVDGPTYGSASLLIYVEGVALNCVVWGYAIAWCVARHHRFRGGGDVDALV